jgi:hypothetical protein
MSIGITGRVLPSFGRVAPADIGLAFFFPFNFHSADLVIQESLAWHGQKELANQYRKKNCLAIHHRHLTTTTSAARS